jgi:mono/diheme cytochrome c family protein
VTRREERGHPQAVRLALCALALTACDVDDWKPDVLREGRDIQAAHTLKRGREQYSMYCAGCHGESGDGEGPASRFMSPKPRDFRKGRVKFAAVPANTLPRDEDLLNTMNHGLHGTSMPAWNLIAHEDKLAIIAYLKTFSEVWQKEAPGAPVPIKPDPWRKKGPEKAIAEGERVYHGIAACSSCHPAYADKPKIVEAMKEYGLDPGFREAMYSSVEKESDWGAPIKPPDFLNDRTKIASTKEELVRVIAAGVGGTAMPSWGDTLTDKQLWGLAYYVESLVQKRSTEEARAMRKALDSQPAYTIPKPEPKPEPPAQSADAVDAGDAGVNDAGKASPGKK